MWVKIFGWTYAITITDKEEESETMLRRERIVFQRIPQSMEEFKMLPQAQMMTPFDTAALTVLALSAYPQNKALSLEMLDFLRGPRPLIGMEKQFIADRFMD